jgi:hypothetical protein
VNEVNRRGALALAATSVAAGFGRKALAQSPEMPSIDVTLSYLTSANAIQLLIVQFELVWSLCANIALSNEGVAADNAINSPLLTAENIGTDVSSVFGMLNNLREASARAELSRAMSDLAQTDNALTTTDISDLVPKYPKR